MGQDGLGEEIYTGSGIIILTTKWRQRGYVLMDCDYLIKVYGPDQGSS
jgi:hypothetical protein